MAEPVQNVVVNAPTSGAVVVSRTQKILVSPATGSVSVINAGPMGPTGATGADNSIENILTVDGQLLTRALGELAPITRPALAADPAFQSAMDAKITTHVAAADPHPVYMTSAEVDSVLSGHMAAADPHPTYLTQAEGNTSFVNVTGDTMTGPLTLPGGNSLVFSVASGYISWYNGATRIGYLQGNAGGAILSSETGVLSLAGSGGINLSGGRVDFGGQSLTGTSGNINGYTMSEASAGYRIVCTTANGYIVGNYFNMTADVRGGWPQYVAGQSSSDNYLRWYNMAGVVYPSGVVASSRVEGNANTNQWSGAGLCASPGAGWAAMGLHPGGIATVQASGNGYGNSIYNRDAGFNAASAQCIAAGHPVESSRRFKKNIATWPPMAGGAATLTATQRIRDLRTVSFQWNHGDMEIPSGRRLKAYMRLTEYQRNRDLPEYELPDHDCAIHDCVGTIDEPCIRIRDLYKTRLGMVAEEVVEAFPEAVHIGHDNQPEAIDYASLTAVLFSVINELVDRIEQLENAA